MVMQTHKDLGFETNINSKGLYGISRLVSDLMRMPVQANKAIVGKNAFAHSSGIHQDGFLKHAETYEIINPEDVGVPASSIVLTARSGRHALRYRLELLGYLFDREELNSMYDKFIALADRKKLVTDDDLQELVTTEYPVKAEAAKKH